jgi:hypothetical protein
LNATILKNSLALDFYEDDCDVVILNSACKPLGIKEQPELFVLPGLEQSLEESARLIFQLGQHQIPRGDGILQKQQHVFAFYVAGIYDHALDDRLLHGGTGRHERRRSVKALIMLYGERCQHHTFPAMD